MTTANARSIPHIVAHLTESSKAKKMLKVSRRVAELRALLQNIVAYEEKIIDAVKKDLGRCAFETYVLEISMIKEELKRAIKSTKAWSTPRTVPTPIILQPGRSYIEPMPKGLVLIISPWNYPFQLSFVPLIAAISAGNCVILKPSELTPASSKVIKEIVHKSLNHECYAVVEGDGEVARELLDHRFDHIFYTGSTNIGREVMKKAAHFLTPVTLELGGKSPVVIDNTADIELAARRILWGKFINAGQTCIAPDYILVDRRFFDKLTDALKKNLAAMLGDDSQENPSYGRIVNERHLKRLVAYLTDGDIIFGGAYNTKDRFFEPTLMTNIKPGSQLDSEEIFGPILVIEPYDELQDAINIVNNRPNPLALYIFSKNKTNIQYLQNHILSGGLSINDCVSHVGVAGLPFGGVGESGMGSYHGQFGFDNLSHLRGVLQKSNLLDNPVKYAPYSEAKLKFAKAVMN